MDINLNVSFEVKDDDAEAEDIALELISQEARKFAAAVLDTLEAHGMKDVKLTAGPEEDIG